MGQMQAALRRPNEFMRWTGEITISILFEYPYRWDKWVGAEDAQRQQCLVCLVKHVKVWACFMACFSGVGGVALAKIGRRLVIGFGWTKDVTWGGVCAFAAS